LTRTLTLTRRAILARINRALAHDGRQLKTAKGGQSEQVGEFYIVDANKVISTDVDLAAVAEQLGVLRPYERLA